MKNDIPQWAKPVPMLFKWMLVANFLVFFWIPGLSAQRVTLALSQEIEVPAGTTISTSGPQSERITGRGAINSRHLQGKYVVSGKNALPYVFVIHKTLTIDSWEHQRVKQLVTVVLEADTPAQTDALSQALKPILLLDPTNRVRINCSLNIDQFTLNNGWFREDKNSITLTDGRTFPIKYLEITNHLFVPASSPLLLNLDRTNLTLGDHQGKIELRMKQGHISTACVEQLTADITDAEVNIDAIRKADITLTNSTITLAEAEELRLTTALSIAHIDSVGQLVIGKTLSDDLTLGIVGEGLIERSTFSDIAIGKLDSGLQFTGKGSDLAVLRVDTALQEFRVVSYDGSVQFPLTDLPAATLRCDDVNENNFLFPDRPSLPKANDNSISYRWGFNNSPTDVRLSGQRCIFHLKQ